MAEHILIADMASYTERNGRDRRLVDLDEPFEVDMTEPEREEKAETKRSSKKLRHSPSSAESSASGVASFTTNHNSVVCLPLVSEGLKLVWTQSDQTRELDSIPELVNAFNLFPYPSSKEVSTLARVCVLPLDKVKVWFMVQRIKYGISWSSEEIEETRRKLAVPELCEDSAETNGANLKTKSKNLDEEKDSDEEESDLIGFVPETKLAKCESPDSHKSTPPCFRSSLPPPQDSYFYRSPADTPATTTADASPDLSESSSQQYRHGRYKKSKAQLAALRKSFLRENWPAEPELKRLQEETGLSRNDIRKWFSDSRYQLRVGRGSLAAAQTFSHQASVGSKHEPQSQTQPLSLTNQKSRQVNGVKSHEGSRNNGIRNSHFFQTFLSNSLEAFGEKLQEPQANDVIEELSGDTFKEEQETEEEPLQLTKTCKIEPEVVELKSSPCSSPSRTPPPTASPTKTYSHRIRASKKSVHSTKASPSQTTTCLSGASTSSSPALTPAGRPRKTKEQLDVLKQHFLKCQWPTSEEYTELVKLTGLPRADVIQWFGDTRYAVKNGQLRWVKGVREQFLAELAAQQSGSGLSNGTGTSTRGGGGRKRKLSRASTDSPDIQPLVSYYLTTGTLNEKDLDLLCKKSRMSYQQVRDWFAAQEVGETDEEIVVA
ncbi:homeobox and leucine zipper encoding a [Xiphophorus hellerii]|uniref:homeobox and leucine zipper encoding a n=1 Tax=Xiphophorus hellerii TaxID=8084 RepID=UPI0013B38A9B|nr:homeobox and leucine zipper protein Homez-like [Xiphophorus hellerii]XP_032421428.1 homeobox and leucine zipper protein Homez-like [Xiphophorus hellerii]